MGSTSFWQAEADATAYPSLSGRVTADVAIIGAGITGTALALCLARAGLRPAVVEARAVASGASGRNGGFLLGGTSEAYAAARERYGIEMARRIWAFSVANHGTLAGLIEEMHAGGWQTGYARTGSLRIASSEAEMAEIRESARLLAADGWAAEVLERESLPAPLRSTYLGASLHPGDGEVQPVRMVQGLARLAAASGARIYERSAAHAVAMGHDGVTVTTDGGAISAGSLVWATNAWLADDSLRTGFPWLAAAIHPTRGQMLATAPVTDRLFEMPCYANYGYQYWRQLPDGRLVVGGWRNLVPEVEVGLDETPNEQVQPALERFVRETLGQHRVAIEHRWAGIMAFSADHLPLVGRLPGAAQVYVAGGYTGHGNAYATRSAEVVAALIRGEAHPDVDLFAPDRLASGSESA